LKAAALKTEIAQKAETWRKLMLQAERLTAAERAKQYAAELEAIPILNPDNIINNCWNTPDKSNKGFSKLSTIEAAQTNPAAVPVAAATDVIVKGIEIIAWPFQKLKTKEEPRFNQGSFASSYKNNVYRYYGNITRVDVTNKTITFASGGKSKQSFVVSARLRSVISLSAFTLKPGSPVWVSGQLTTLEEANPANRLVLENSAIYSPNTLSANK